MKKNTQTSETTVRTFTLSSISALETNNMESRHIAAATKNRMMFLLILVSVTAPGL
jgi:hypothetical protein